MIIVEGPDGSGKTTLATEIAERFAVPLVHSPGPKEEWLTGVFSYHCAQPREIVVYDRCYFSEFVYGPILRGRIGLAPWVIDYAEKVWLPQIKPLIIFCDPPDATIKRGLRGREQMIGVEENIPAIIEGYRNYFREFAASEKSVSFMTYDWTNPDQQSFMLVKIAQWVIKRKEF